MSEQVLEPGSVAAEGSGDVQPSTVQVPTCVTLGCERPQGSYGRGLCNPCRRRYQRMIEKRETRWDLLEKAGKCLPKKAAPSIKEKKVDAPAVVEKHKRELARHEFRYEILDKIADMLMAKKSRRAVEALLESEGVITSKHKEVRSRSAALWIKKAKRRLVHASGFPLTAHVDYIRKKLTKIIENESGVSVANRIAAIREYRSLFIPKQVHFEGQITERKELSVSVVRERYAHIVNGLCDQEDSPPALEAKPLEDAPDAGRDDPGEPVPAGDEPPGQTVVLDSEASGVLGL